jgi:MFS family permease
MRSVLDVLGIVARNRELRRVQLAYATFNSGEWATWIAMLVYAYSRGGVNESGLVAAGMLVPSALLAPVAAALGERVPPGRALLAGYGLQAASCLATAAAVYANAPALVVYPLLAVMAVAFTMTRPTQAAFAPGLAHTPRELAATNVASGTVEGISVLVAPVLTGVVLGLGSPATVFALAGVGCALGALLVTPLRDAVPVVEAADPDERASLFGEGPEVMRRDPQSRMLVLLLGAQCVALGALDVLYVELARGVLHRGGDWAGYLCGAAGAGGVLAVAFTARLVGRPRLAGPLAVSIAVWSLAFLGLAAVPGVGAALGFLLLAGGSEKTFDVTGRMLLQRVARADALAGVFGLLEGFQMGGYAVGSLLAPALVALGGAPAAFLGVGAILPLVALLTGRRLLDIDRHATVPVVEIALLRSMPLFAALPPATIETLARALEPLAQPAGTDVIRQGEDGDRFYVIADGEVDVVASGRNVATLRRGDGFGEIALLNDVPRTATVTARTDVRLYALEREIFLVTLTGHAASRRSADDLAEQRLAELRAHGDEHVGTTVG